MPQAKRSTSTRGRFKEPAAFKRLTTSLDTAQKALTELSKGSGRAGSKGAKDLYSDLRGFVTSARRDSNKVAKALQREFDQAQKQLAKAAKGTGSGSRRASASRSTSSRSTSSRSSRSGSSRSTSRSTSGRSTSRRTSGSGSTKRTSTRRGTRKS